MADTNSAASSVSANDTSTGSGGSAAHAQTQATNPANPGNPTASTGTGYSAQAADARTDERPGADGGARSPNAQTDDMTPEQLRAALKAARDEAAANRKARQELADLQRHLEDEKLSETEKLQKQLAELQRERDTITQQTQERVIRADVRSAARDLGLKPELAYRLIDYSAITFNDDGDPTNIGELLSQAMTDYGLTPSVSPSSAAARASAAASPAPSVSGRAAAAQSGGATNPGAGRGPGAFTKAQIARMSPREYEANKQAIYEAMRNGQVR